MVDKQARYLDGIFYALSNSTRRDIMLELARRDLTVNELAEKYDMTVQGVSKHIQVLVRSGLITQKKSGRRKFCRFNQEHLESISDVLNEYRVFWNERLDSLKQYLEKS